MFRPPGFRFFLRFACYLLSTPASVSAAIISQAMIAGAYQYIRISLVRSSRAVLSSVLSRSQAEVGTLHSRCLGLGTNQQHMYKTHDTFMDTVFTFFSPQKTGACHYLTNHFQMKAPVAPSRSLREAFARAPRSFLEDTLREGFAKAPRAPSFGNDSSDNDKPPKMCWAGGWCLNRALSYLCFSVEQGEKKSSVRGASDFSKYYLFIFRQRWKRSHVFPSPYFIIHQYFHVSPSPQIVWDQTVASPPAVGVSISPYFEDFRLVQIGTFGGLRTVSHTSLTT